MRLALVAALVTFAVSQAASATAWTPSSAWLAQAMCVHRKEGAWDANTGNGMFGGMQFKPQTWRQMGGSDDPAFAHPGDPLFRFAQPRREQLYRAWLLWRHDGRTWRSWGAVGAACSSAR